MPDKLLHGVHPGKNLFEKLIMGVVISDIRRICYISFVSKALIPAMLGLVNSAITDLRASVYLIPFNF